MYKIVKVAYFYRDFLQAYYRENPDIGKESYDYQYRHLMDKCFSWSDFYSRHLINLGNDAYEIVFNADTLQKTWARENGSTASGMGIVFDQIKKIAPDVVFFQDSITFNGPWVRALKEAVPSIKLTIGFVCSRYSKWHLEQFNVFDFVLVCAPNFRNVLTEAGIKTYDFLHGFESSIIDKIAIHNNLKESDFIFLGSFIPGTEGHGDRQLVMNELIKSGVDIDIYANIAVIPPMDMFLRKSAYAASELMKKMHMDELAKKIPGIKKTYFLNESPTNVKNISLIKNIAKPPLFGLDMYKALAKSKIGFNSHGYAAGDYACNIRLFEITGVGSCMITDWKKNINELFEDGKEVMTYKSADECIEKVKWLLDHPAEREQIAKAGQQRTLRDHSVENRAALLNEIIISELRDK